MEEPTEPEIKNELCCRKWSLCQYPYVCCCPCMAHAELQQVYHDEGNIETCCTGCPCICLLHCMCPFPWIVESLRIKDMLNLKVKERKKKNMDFNFRDGFMHYCFRDWCSRCTEYRNVSLDQTNAATHEKRNWYTDPPCCTLCYGGTDPIGFVRLPSQRILSPAEYEFLVPPQTRQPCI